MTGLLHLLFAPGFFSSAPVRLALLTGGVAALVSGAVGAFTVLRGQSYAGHALADISVTGGSGSYLLGISPLLGFAGTGVLAAGVMDMIGIRRPRGRDLATGIVRGAGLGIAALLLYWDTTHTAATGAAVTILFGSMFTLSPTVVPLVIACGAVALAIVVVLYRPLLLSSVSADLAAARGIRVRAVGLACLLAIALAVSLSALTVGTILSTALLVGPAAIALRITRRPGLATVAAALIGVAVTWLGIVLAYDSFTWPPRYDGWPVSFFVVALTFAGYLLAQLGGRGRRAARRRPARLAAASPPVRPRRPREVAAVFQPFMMNAWVVATIVAVVAGVVGFFVVMRGSAFVADAVPQGAFAGAAGASLIGVSTLVGLGVFALAGALVIGWLGRRGRHDVATALTLVLMLGLGALFLSFTTQYSSEIFALLFGEILGISSSEILPVAAGGLICIVAVMLMYRPLLLSSLAPESGEARGVKASRMELLFLLVVAVATSMTLPVVGALLIFSLMIGPPAAARSLTSSPLRAMVLSVVIAVALAWVSVAASYQTNWPVGFFVGVGGAVCYAGGRGWSAWSAARRPAVAPA